MTSVVTLLAVLALLVVGAWIGLFGALGAVVGPRRGRSRLRGALLGVIGGPFALTWMLLRPGGRAHAPDHSDAGPDVTRRGGGRTTGTDDAGLTQEMIDDLPI